MQLLDRLAQLGVPLADLTADSRAVKMGSIFAAFPAPCSTAATTSPRRSRAARPRCCASARLQLERGWDVPTSASTTCATRISEIAGAVHGNPVGSLWVAGVTGTNGKTSVSQWIAAALDSLGRRSAVIGTLGNGMVGERVEAKNTTPDPIVLQRSLADTCAAARAWWRWKVSSHGLDQGRVAASSTTRGVHQPHARPPRLPRHHGELRRGQVPLFSRARPAARGDQRRRRVRREFAASSPAAPST
jgi:UDP-N-acetylmuramoyl-L-alanyl-D-glutamate--2,6-diaminopimelate ligase